MTPPFILQTERLKLRPFSEDDAEALFFLNGDPEVIKYTGNKPFKNLDGALEFIKEYQKIYDHQGFGRWAVVSRETGVVMGWCGLKKNEENDIDLGFRLMRKYWNIGFATEAALACLDFGFRQLDMQSIVGRADARNLASIRTLEKIGMTFWKDAFMEKHGLIKYYKINRTDG